MPPLEKRLETIERLLRDLLKEKKVVQETWVKAEAVMELTSWDKEGMRKARKYSYIRYKTINGSYWYSLESIPDKFLKKEAAV